MLGLVYATPPLPIPAPSHAWESLKITWTDYRGRVWLMCGQTGVKLRPGVRGFTLPPITHHSLSSPALHGATYRGWRANEREVFWPITVFNDTSAEAWVHHDRDFWEGMHPDREGVWTVETPDSVRTMRLRVSGDGDHAMEYMPTLFGWQQYELYFTAYDPFWYGEPVTQSWGTSEPVEFFNGASKAPNFNIMSAAALDSAKLTNEGGVDAWPVWEIEGQVTSFAVGVGDRQVIGNFVIPEGQRLYIDTDPTKREVLLGDPLPGGGVADDATDVYKDLASWDFAPIPPGESRPLSLSLSGTGTVKVTINPRHLRAW